MQSSIAKYERKFIVCFTQASVKRWWLMFCKRFSHVHLYTKIGGIWCEISATIGGMYIREIKLSEIELKAKIIFDKGEYIDYTVYAGDIDKPRAKGIKTCVSVTKDLLGIKDKFIITPDQLYRRIR